MNMWLAQRGAGYYGRAPFLLALIIVMGFGLSFSPARVWADIDGALQEGEPRLVRAWGSYGTSPGEFRGMSGIDVGEEDRVYVTDWDNGRIQVFEADGSFVRMWGAPGSAPGQFIEPDSVAVDELYGEVYVADNQNNRIQVFDMSGQWLRSIGTYGHSDGQLYHVHDVAVDPAAGEVYAVDHYNHRIQVFDRLGTYLRKWGGYGSEPGLFWGPHDLALDLPNREAYVIDFYNHRIQVFDLQGHFKRQWGRDLTGSNQLSRPIGVVVDDLGRVFVSDTGTHALFLFDRTGTQLNMWTGAEAGANYTFNEPRGVAVDSQHNIIVANAGRNQIQVYSFGALPSLGRIEAPVEPLAVHTQVVASASLTDPDTSDTHTATWDWGDGTTSTAQPVNGSVSGSHAYSAAGVYTVRLTVTDSGGLSAEALYEYIVVYDPSAGFVTGGGWIESPPGAYVPDPSLAGKATFGFVAKYQKGATVPSGNTQFQFHAANFTFRSTAYDWLVVAGARAQYKGIGTVNGAGSYGFMLTAIDGQQPGGGGTDRLRLKVWDLGTDAVVYDNQIGAGDTDEVTTALMGGSIVVHTGK